MRAFIYEISETKDYIELAVVRPPDDLGIFIGDTRIGSPETTGGTMYFRRMPEDDFS